MTERTYSQEDLARMSEEQRVEVFLKATTVRGTVLVLGPDGKPKYDDPALAGTYAEEAR